MHRRVECQECDKSWAELDPRFLPQFPTNVLDIFPFVTSVKGPAVDHFLLAHFSNLQTVGVSLGRYVKSMNEIYKYRYSIDWATYSDSLYEWDNQQKLDGVTTSEPQPFQPFASLGEYAGIELSRSVFKDCYLKFVRSKEKRMQKSFQSTWDDIVIADRTHQFSKRIHVMSKKGAPFEASYTVMSGNGKVGCQRITFGKSNLELRELLKDIKKVRSNAGVPEIKQFFSDGGKDVYEWTRLHKELEQGIRPYTPTHLMGFPLLNLADD
jgi:hypothetical protein